MICGNCKKESDPASRVCPYCGRFMGAESSAFDPPENTDEAYIRRTWTTRNKKKPASANKVRRKRGRRRRPVRKKNTYQKPMVNWVKLGAFALALLLFAVAGAFIWQRVTPSGQLFMARMGRDANAEAYWAVGTEYLDQGYIARAVEAYLTALEKEPERPDLGDKLLLLAEAYEAAGNTGEAEAVYTRVFTELKKEDPVAYRQTISIMQSQERLLEAVSLMQLAYEKTGDDSFFNQRSQLVPLPPEASLPAGRHVYSKTLEFISPQGYDIFYTTGDGLLPETGTLYKEPITLDEGAYSFRAVSVSSELVSDEITIRYTITFPSPMAPKANMASQSYDRPIKVSLRVVDEDKEVDLYYTIDGSRPSLDSPQFTGDPILLPGGRVILRAIAVNRYGKISNELNIEYKINARFNKYFRSDDKFKEFTLLKTTREQFYTRYGKPDSEAQPPDDAVSGIVTQANYPWGEARFVVGEEGDLLYNIETASPEMTGPRGTKVGMTLKDVTDKFRDMGQLPNKRGDRGIYYDMAEGYARYTVGSDDPLTGMLRYMYVGGPDGTSNVLSYTIKDGRVTNISLRFVSRKLSLVE